MANSSFNFAPDAVLEQFSTFNVDMAVEEDNDFVCDKNNTHATLMQKQHTCSSLNL